MPDIEWEEVESLFHEALALPKERRTEFLDQVCQGNRALHGKVSHLLSCFCDEEQFLQEVDIAQVFGEVELEERDRLIWTVFSGQLDTILQNKNGPVQLGRFVFRDWPYHAAYRLLGALGLRERSPFGVFSMLFGNCCFVISIFSLLLSLLSLLLGVLRLSLGFISLSNRHDESSG